MLKRKSVVMVAFLCVLFVPEIVNAQGWVQKWAVNYGTTIFSTRDAQGGMLTGDADGDGIPEILVYGDNQHVVVHDGLTGQIELLLDLTSVLPDAFFLRIDPIFEDIDNDNRAEIVLSTNQYTLVYEFVGGSVGVNDPEQSNIPKSSQLFQNYPNPFNPETTIEYSVIESSPVEILIFNQLGQRVRILVDEQNIQPGKYSVTWDSKNDNGNLLASGNYYFV